jgi:hypothetical protein
VKVINAVHLSVLVNSRPLWQVTTNKPITVEESSDGNTVTFTVNMKLKYYGASLLSAYEALFTDEQWR